jgi:hypothetical protein
MLAATLNPIRLECYLPRLSGANKVSLFRSRQSGQILAAVRIEFECCWNGQNGCRFKCSHTFLQCIPRQMLVCCVVSVLARM